ncbi:MAG: YdcF family protein [Kovacikia sp.]
MLDSTLCARTTTKWVELSWKFTHIVAKPINFPFRGTLIVLLIVAAGLLFLILKNPQWKRRFLGKWRWKSGWTRTAIILTLVCLFITSPPGIALATQVLVSQVPHNPNTTADAIVVLGRGPRYEGSRTDTALALWQAKQAPRIFVGGHGDGARLVKKLETKGIPQQALDGEECSLTTEENARFAANILMPQGVKQIILVTDPPHMLRSVLTFQSQGFNVIAHTSPLPENLSNRERMVITFREYGGLLSYALKGRVFEQDAR